MFIKFTLYFYVFVVLCSGCYAHKFSGAESVSVLAIGNGHYRQQKLNMNEINFSAASFLACFEHRAATYMLQSGEEHILTKNEILEVIRQFVLNVQKGKGVLNRGIIYYCGHGLAGVDGSLYFIPGELDVTTRDVTAEMLSEKLINIDEIKNIILKAQQVEGSGPESRFVLMGDCCSVIAASKLYEGIGYQFGAGGVSKVVYDSGFIAKINAGNSSLLASAMATLDSNGNIVVPPVDSTKPTINEFHFLTEDIRAGSFLSRGNLVYYSSAVGATAEPVPYPLPRSNKKVYDVAPICRRTLLFFEKQPAQPYLQPYLKALTKKSFDKLTAPILLNPTRNRGNR